MAEVKGTWSGEGSGPWNGSWDDSNLVNLNRELLREIYKTQHACEEIYTRVAFVDDQITEISNAFSGFFTAIKSFSDNSGGEGGK